MLLAQMEDAEKLPKIKPRCTTTLNVHGLTTLLTRKRNTTGLNRKRNTTGLNRERDRKPNIDERPRVRQGSLSNRRFFRQKYRFVHVSEIPVTGGSLILIFVRKKPELVILWL
jgi:hypothetical protein